MNGPNKAPYTLRIERRVVKAVSSFPPKARRQIASRLRDLPRDPRPHDSRAIQGLANTFRIDVGEYRVVYDIDYGSRVVTVWRIRHRKDVYRNL